MKKTHAFRLAVMPLWLLGFAASYAQLPQNYITKLSYMERTEVAYGLPEESTMYCLTLGELSRYHGYMQLHRIDEIVDHEGDVLSDKFVLDEYQVRDEWMEAFSRITVGKNSIDVYGSDATLFHQVARIPDSNAVMLTPAQAAQYGYYNLHPDTINLAFQEFVNYGYTVTQFPNYVQASHPRNVLIFNHLLKFASSTEYDSNGVKVRESVMQFEVTDAEDSYFPATETTYEWFMSDSGCCVRKVTNVDRFSYTREVNMTMQQQPGLGVAPQMQERTDIRVTQIPDRNAFRIHSQKYAGQQFSYRISDLGGRILTEGEVREGAMMELPPASRIGMYILHLYSPDGSGPLVEKLMQYRSGEQF